MDIAIITKVKLLRHLFVKMYHPVHCIACLLLRGKDEQKLLANGVKNDSREDDDDFLVHHHGLA